MTAALAMAFSVGLGWPWIAAYLVAINAVTFVAYAHDKRASRKHKPRTPEATLHLLAGLGGSPAALIAQQLLRHKTIKWSFQLVFWGIVLAQAAALLPITRFLAR